MYEHGMKFMSKIINRDFCLLISSCIWHVHAADKGLNLNWQYTSELMSGLIAQFKFMYEHGMKFMSKIINRDFCLLISSCICHVHAADKGLNLNWQHTSELIAVVA